MKRDHPIDEFHRVSCVQAISFLALLSNVRPGLGIEELRVTVFDAMNRF